MNYNWEKEENKVREFKCHSRFKNSLNLEKRKNRKEVKKEGNDNQE